MDITTEEAIIIRDWRQAGCTWRKIAANAARLWPEKDIMSGNQLEGVELCHAAADLLGEDSNKDPWN